MASSPPVVLTIAGSDNSAGAGIQADLKTITAIGAYALTSVTCVVAEVPGLVSMIQPIEPSIVVEQVRLSLQAFPVAAIKLGMLHSRPIIEALCDTLSEVQRGSSRRIPLIVDPVMVASSGDTLLQPDAVQLYRERLLPLATLVTPNLDEAGVILGRTISTISELQAAGDELVRAFGCAFLMKGGHLQDGEKATDVLVLTDGAQHAFSAPRIANVSTHGTGCTMSAAIAAYLARGLPLPEACERAKLYVTRAIRKHLSWRSPSTATEALNHSV